MKTIRVSNQELLDGVNYSSLSSSATAASGTLSVYSISDFTVKQALLIGELGQEGSETINTHSTTDPTGTTVTLATNLVKSHPKDSKVYILPYNQVEFSHATTTTGDKTVMATSTINTEGLETTYNDSTYTSGYYFTRFKNSVANTYSDYSDPIPYGGFATNTVAYIIEQSLAETGKELSDILTYDRLIDAINSCLRYTKGKLKRWSNTQVFNYELDSALVEDDYTWTLPTDYYDKNSNRSTLQIWITDQDNLQYVDKQEFDDLDRDSDSGTPKYFTIYDGSIYITPKVGSELEDDKIYMDYYTDITEVNSDSDEITLSRYDMIKHWLKWQIRMITENNGKPDFTDGDYIMYNTILTDAVRRESSGQKYKSNVKVSGISYRGESESNFDVE